jgi:predicted transcriptional regulator
LLPCEVGVQTVLPAIRALMARTILEKHGLKEKQVAELLGLSQSAISRYTRRNRGNTLTIENLPEVETLIDQIILLVFSKESHQTAKVMGLICQTCKVIREKGLVCKICQKKNGENIATNCAFCRST